MPQSPLKCVSAVNPSTLSERTSGSETLNCDLPVPVTAMSDSQTKTAQTLISVNSLLSSPTQSNAGVPTTVRAVQGIPQTTTFKNITNSPLKRCQASSIVPEQSTFQKVFLVTPTTNIPTSTNATTAPVPSAVPGSRFLFMSQSASACSTVTIPKEPITSESSVTATVSSKAVEAMNVKPNLVQATGNTTASTPTKVQGINISGLATRIMDEGTVATRYLAPLSEAATKVTSATASSGQIDVQKLKPAATTCPFKGSVKVSGSADGKTVTFSTYGIGHMASSALLSAVDQNNTSSPISVSNTLNNKSEPVPGTLTPNLASPSIGTLINKDATLPRGLIKDKSWVTTALTPSPVKPPVALPVPRVSSPLTLSTTKTSHTPGTPFPLSQTSLSSIIRVPVSPISGTTTMQEKVVINTSAPLAPGTQLFINNMRFVVPAQGLGSGTHVLLISSPATCPGGPVGTPVSRVTSNPPPVTSAVPGPVVAPGMPSNRMSVRLPVCTTAKVGTSDPVPKTLTAVRASLVATDSAVFAQVPQLGSVASSGQQSLTSIVRLSAPEGKGHIAASSHSISSCSKGIAAVPAQSQKSLPSLVTPGVLQTGLGSPPPQPQRTALPPVISRTAPAATMPPLSSTVSRMQTLPVATVPPIGGTFSSSQATPIATVPPSVSTVIMAPCQPLRGVQPGSIRMPVVLTNPSQVQRKIPVQVPGVPTVHTPSKLMLSPDGAILNVVRCPAIQSVPVVANAMTAQVMVPTCSSATGTVLNALDSQRIVTDKPEGPNY